MKIGIVVRVLGTQGGTERVAHGFSGWLSRGGHTVTVICHQVDDQPPGVAADVVPTRARGRLGRLLAQQVLVRRGRALDLDRLCSFIRVPGADLWRAGGGCHAVWRQGRRWSAADALEEQLDRRAALGSGVVVANSRMAAEELVKHYGLAAARIRVVHNGVDLDRFKPAQSRDQSRVVFLGSGFSRKGLETAIQVVERLPGLRLEVIGGDPRAGRWSRRAERGPAAERIHFHGRCADPERLLAGAGAMILPTRYDPFSTAVLEALAVGVPAVTSGRHGASEVLPAAWLRVEDPTDVGGFAVALERALQDRTLAVRSRLAAEAHPAEASFAALLSILQEPV